MPLSKPPLNQDGEVKPHDHDEIKKEHRVIRRISDEYCVFDEKARDGRRVSRMAFQPSSDGNRGMSIDIELSIQEAGWDVRSFVTTPKYIGSVCFTAGFLRSESLMVGYDPLQDNVHHGEVWGSFNKGRQTRLLRAAEWFVEIPEVSLHLD